MDTNSNIKFNVEGDDKFSQFLEKTQKSFKELNEKSLRLFNTSLREGSRNLKDITKDIRSKSSVVEKLITDYTKATNSTNSWVSSLGKLAKSVTLLGGAMNALNVVTVAGGIAGIVGTGITGVMDSITKVNTGINVMAASGFDGSPLMNSFSEITAVLTGNEQAIEAFTAKATASFNSFEQKLNEVNIVFGLSQERLSEYGEALQNGLEKNLKNSVSSLTGLNAAYQAASAGFTDFQNNLEVVQLAVKANKAAPGSDLFQIGGALGKGAGILNTRDVKELETVTAKWLATEQLGLTTVGDMTEYISDMYSSLKNAGIGTKDLVNETQGLVVAFTKLGGKVTDISTEMQAFARNTIGKTPEAMKALEGLVDAQGKAITLNQEYFGRKGVVQGIVDFAEAVGYNTEKIKEVYNETNAFNFAMKVLAQNGKLAKDSIESISQVTSENLNEAFESATFSSQAKMEQITNAYDEIMISFGKAFQKRSQEGVKSIEWYKEVLVTFKEPLVDIAGKMVSFFDNVSKFTGVISSVAKMLAGIAGTIISYRAFNLIFSGITDGFKNLRKEGVVLKDLYTSNQGLLSIGKQILGLDQQKLLSQNRINDAIKNSTKLEQELTTSVANNNTQRLSNISVVQKEIDAIVARDESIIKSKQKVTQVEESLNKKVGLRDQQQSQVSSTQKGLSNLKTLKTDIDNAFKDNLENIERSKKLSEIAAQESLIKQGTIGKKERDQLKELNTEKLRLQTTYNKTTLDQLESLQKQKDILNNKAKKSDRDYKALDNIYKREDQLLDRERTKDRTPLNTKQRETLNDTRKDLNTKIQQQELILLTERQKLQEANNIVDKETQKLNKARVEQAERLNSVTKTTTELAVVQQDLNTKRNNLDKIDFAFKGQQEKLYVIQNTLRKEQSTLDKIRNKDSLEYQQQLQKVVKLQEQEATQQKVVQKAKVTQQAAQKEYNKADIEAKNKVKELTRQQGLAEGSLIDLKTKSGNITFKNTAFNRGIIASVEGYNKVITAAQTPLKSLGELQDKLKNKIIDLKTNISQTGAEAGKVVDETGTKVRTMSDRINDSAKVIGESLKGALISTGVGLIIAALGTLVTKIFQASQETKKIEKSYKEFNKTLEEFATKFDRANISFDKSIQGLDKFNDRVEKSNKLLSESEPGMWESIGGAIANATKWFGGFLNAGNEAIPILGDLDRAVAGIFSSFSDAEFLKRTAKMSQVSDFIQDYELALRGQNKELEKGNLLTETSNQKIKNKMILTGEDLEREKAANSTRIESFQSMTDVQKKELEKLKGKGDKLTDRDKAQIAILEAEISRREKVIEVSKKQFDDQIKYYEARNLLLDRENKFSNEQVSLEELKGLQGQVDSSQIALNKNISAGLDIYSSSIKDSATKSKQFLTDLKDGSLSVKASIKSLGGDIYKVGENGKVLSKLPDTVLKSIETVIKGQEIDGKKYSLEQVLNLKETRDALKEAGVEIPKDLKVLADKMRKSYEFSESEIKLIDLKSLEKDLANFSVLSDKYQEKKRQFLSTTKEDVGATTFSTSLKKSLRLVETDLQTTLNALDSSSKGLNTYIISSTQKFTEQALNGTLDLTEGLKELGKVESELEPKQLEKLKTAITGKNKDDILSALKEIGITTEKALTADSIDFNKFEANLGGFIESLNAVAESGEATSEEVAKKFETVYDQMKGKVTPAAYKDLTETLISYEKAASEQRINLITMETNALEQQKKYGLVLESDYIKEINQLNINTTEENIKNKQIELKRLLSLYKETAPQVIKAKAELETLELDLKSQRSNNPVEIAKVQSKERFEILKKDLELGNVTRKQYIEEEIKDTKNLYSIQLSEKQKTLSELMNDEVKNAKAIKALRKSMELDEKDHNLALLEINRRRIDEQFKIQSNAITKRELQARQASSDGNTKSELENTRKLESEKISLNIKTLEARLALETKGSEKFIEIEKQLLEAQISLRETQIKQTKDRVNESIEAKKVELSTIAALEERNNIRGTNEKSLESTRKLKEKELQLTIDSIKNQLKLYQKGSKERLALEQQLIQETTRLQKTQFDNDKDRLEASFDKQRKTTEDKLTKLEGQTLKGNSNEQLEASRKLKEEQINNTIDSLKQTSKLYKEGSKERIEIERQITKEINNLQKTQLDNRKERLEIAIEDKRRELEKRQIALERASIAGTTDEDLEAERQMKEKDIRNTIDSLTQKANLYGKGKRERIAIEQEIAKETLKLDKQVYENQKSRLTAQIDNRKRAFRESQQQLEKLLVLGTSVEDSKKLRANKEEEIQLNISGIEKELSMAKKGSVQRKNLEIALRDEQIKLDKQRIDNKRDLINEEVELEKTKITKIQSLLERSNIGGTFEENLDKLRNLREKETLITIDSLKKQLATFKGNAKERLSIEAQLSQEITKLQQTQFNNRKEKLEAELERSKNKLDLQIAKQEAFLTNGSTESELKQMETLKVKEAELTVESIRKQMKLWKAGSKERLALEVQLQKELNNLDKARLDSQKNNIQIALDFKRTKEEISNVESEKALLKGDISREEFEDKLTTSSQRMNLLQQEAFSKQLKLYQKGSKEYLDILKQMSQLQVDYQKSVVEKAVRDIDRLTKIQNNSIEAQKQSINRQISASDSYTKELQEQIKLEDSRNSVIKATSDYQISILELSKKSTGDVEKRAKIDVQIAEMKQKALLESQQLELNSIKNNEIINRAALEREQIQLNLNRLELDRTKLQTQAELRKAKLNKLDQASIDALQLQLDSINDQYSALGRSENLISTQIANQAEISQNQLKVIKQQQDLARRNSALDVEQAKQNVIIAGYEKQISQLKMKGTLIEANANKEKMIGDMLTKAYDTQISILNSRKELMDSTLSSIDTLYGIEQSMAKSDLTKDKLAKDQAKDRISFLEFQQSIERQSFDLEKAKNKIVRERQKVELEIAEINARQALAMAKVEEARTNARKDATDEEKLAAKLAVESAEQGILAAKTNKALSLEISKIEEQSEKNKEAINARNQRNQMLQAQQAYAQLTANTSDDREIAGRSRQFREQDQRSLANIPGVSTQNIDKIISDFQKAMEARKPIEQSTEKEKKNEKLTVAPSIPSYTTSSYTSKDGKGTTISEVENDKPSENNNKKEESSKKDEITSILNFIAEKLTQGFPQLSKDFNRTADTISKSVSTIGSDITKQLIESSGNLSKSINDSFKLLTNSLIGGTSTSATTKPITPKPKPRLPKGTIIKGKDGQEDMLVVEQPTIVAPPNPTTYDPNRKGEINNTDNLISKTKEPTIDSLKTIRQSIDAFSFSFDRSNQAKKNEADKRHQEQMQKEDTLNKNIQELIDVVEKYIEKGGNVTINSPINVQGGNKDTGLDINQHLYNLATKIERRQK